MHIPQVKDNVVAMTAVYLQLPLRYMQPLATVWEILQSKMRNHLLQCFKTRKLTPFPTVDKKARKRAESYFEVKVDVFCTCMMPDTYGDMVQSLADPAWTVGGGGGGG